MAAKKSAREDLVDRLHVGGLRKSVARRIADGKNPPKAVRGLLDSLKSLSSGIEDRATGGSTKRKAAAKKAAATRKRNATKRSTAAKKGARTRARAR
jgi:hypothetical protein